MKRTETEKESKAERERERERLTHGPTVMTRVQQVLSQVTAEDPLPEDAPLLQLLLGGPRLHEGAEEGDQLAVLLRHCGGTEGTHTRG